MLYYFVYFLMLAYTIFISRRTLHMLQQNLYNENNRYIKWMLKNNEITIFNVSLIAIVLSIGVTIFKDNTIIQFLLFLIMGVYVLSYYEEKKIVATNQNKKPLVYTKRIKRLIVTLSIIYILPIAFAIIFPNLKNILLIVSTILTGFSFFTTFIALIINKPVEKAVYNHFEKMAKEKLESFSNLKVIGIT